MRPRLLLAAICLATLAGVVSGHAATLGGLTTDNFGAASATVGRCDNAVTAAYTQNDDDEVTAVTIDGIADPACSGGLLKVALTGVGGVLLGSGQATVPTDGDAVDDSVTPTISPAVFAGDVVMVKIVIVGP